MVDASACSASRMMRSQAITGLWSAWRSSADVVIPSVFMKCCTSSRYARRVRALFCFCSHIVVLGDVSALFDRREAAAAVDRRQQVRGVVDHPSPCPFSSFVAEFLPV